MKRSANILFLILLPMLSGLLIYLSSRSESIFLNQWISKINQGKVLTFFQNLIPGNLLPQWIKFSLPDALWMLSLTTLVLFIWDFKLHKKSMLWVGSTILCGIVLEILQLFGFIRGTFDVLDLLFLIIAGSIPLFFILFKQYTCKTRQNLSSQ
jgi:hypothetical protein